MFGGKEGIDYPYGNFASLVSLPKGEALLFGGKANGYSKDLWLFSTKDKTWKKVDASGDLPPGTYGHGYEPEQLN